MLVYTQSIGVIHFVYDIPDSHGYQPDRSVCVEMKTLNDTVATHVNSNKTLVTNRT